MWAKWPIRLVVISGFSSTKCLGVFLLPPDGMLVHHRITLSITLASKHLYSPIWRWGHQSLRSNTSRGLGKEPALRPDTRERRKSSLTNHMPTYNWHTILKYIWNISLVTHTLTGGNSNFILKQGVFLTYMYF